MTVFTFYGHRLDSRACSVSGHVTWVEGSRKGNLEDLRKLSDRSLARKSTLEIFLIPPRKSSYLIIINFRTANVCFLLIVICVKSINWSGACSLNIPGFLAWNIFWQWTTCLKCLWSARTISAVFVLKWRNSRVEGWRKPLKEIVAYLHTVHLWDRQISVWSVLGTVQYNTVNTMHITHAMNTTKSDENRQSTYLMSLWSLKI